MKARPFLAALLAAALALLSFGFVAWWLLLEHGPLGLQSQSLQLPLAARFVPRTAPLSLHWLLARIRLLRTPVPWHHRASVARPPPPWSGCVMAPSPRQVWTTRANWRPGWEIGRAHV